MTNIIDRFQYDAKVQALKYLVSKLMFCSYSSIVLDYRNAIMITITRDGKENSTVIHGQYQDRIEDIKKQFENKGCEVEIFVNIKKYNQIKH